MSTLAQKRAFCEKHFRDPKGMPFSLAGREWVLDDYWRALDGFKFWPRAPGRTEAAEENDHPELCEACQSIANTLTEWTFDHPSLFGLYGKNTPEQDAHHETGCTGLILEPTVFTWIDLPRREGKTFNFFGYGCSSIAIDSHVGITFVSGSEGQSDALFIENFRGILERAEGIGDAWEARGSRVTWKKTKSFIEYVPTTHRSITGKGRSHVVIDEARDFDARSMMALWPSILANNGVMCPRGHVHGPRSDAIKLGEARCPSCRERLVPWFGRALFMSSAGVVDDKTWHATGIDRLLVEPDRNHHAYRRLESENPNVHAASKDAGARVFRKIPATADLVAIEVDNVSSRRGETFLEKAQVQRVINPKRRTLAGYAKKAIGFLDTSDTGHLTSLNVVVEDEEKMRAIASAKKGRALPFEAWVHAVLEIWDPHGKDGTRPVLGGVIDESTVLPWFEENMSLWPGLEVWLDTRGRAWARRFVQLARAGTLGKTSRAWGRRIHGFEGGIPERRSGYDALEEFILNERCELIDHPALRREFESARKKRSVRGGYDVREEKKGQNHLDIVDGLSVCCHQIHLRQVQKKTSLVETGQHEEVADLRRRAPRERERSVFSLITDSAAGVRLDEDSF